MENFNFLSNDVMYLNSYESYKLTFLKDFFPTLRKINILFSLLLVRLLTYRGYTYLGIHVGFFVKIKNYLISHPRAINPV